MWATVTLGLMLAAASARAQVDSFREDGKCGPDNLAPNGKAALCQPIPPFPTCCQINGHCGWHCNESDSDKAAPQAAPQAQPAPSAAPPKTRPDGRCGADFTLDDGTPAECDPNSNYWCCSEFGFCGGAGEHCNCDKCINFRIGLQDPVNGRVRSNARCGEQFPLPDGTPSECNGTSAYPCCSTHGFCGSGAEHCSCPGCVDYRSGKPVVTPLFSGNIRNDRRCGPEFPLPNGQPSECDPASQNPCCSNWGFCGPGAEHCACATCKDYRTPEQIAAQDFVGRVRTDRRCGLEFRLPNSNEPSECNPDSENFCCSKWGFCGGDEEHCSCPECVNYKNKN